MVSRAGHHHVSSTLPEPMHIPSAALQSGVITRPLAADRCFLYLHGHATARGGTVASYSIDPQWPDMRRPFEPDIVDLFEIDPMGMPAGIRRRSSSTTSRPPDPTGRTSLRSTIASVFVGVLTPSVRPGGRSSRWGARATLPVVPAPGSPRGPTDESIGHVPRPETRSRVTPACSSRQSNNSGTSP